MTRTQEIEAGQVRVHHRTGLRVKVTRQVRNGRWAGIYLDHRDRGGGQAERTFAETNLARYYSVETP